MPVFYLMDFRTGLLLDEFEPLTYKWSDAINEAEEIQVSIDLNDPNEARRDWKNAATGWKTGIAMNLHGRWYGGPIMPHEWDEDEHTLSLTAKGFWTYLDHRNILPPAAATAAFIGTDLKPNPALDTNLTGWDFGTIAKKLVQQALSWPGANFPMLYQSDRVGTRARPYAAVDFKKVGDALRDLTEVINGPEMRFQMYQIDDTHVGWQFATGTEAQPRLQSATVHYWDLAAMRSSAKGLKVKSDPTLMADGSYSLAGRGDDSVIVGRAMSTKLRDAGYPYLEVVDTGHSDVTVQSTANSYAQEGLRIGQKQAQFTSFEALADMSPFITEISPGDLGRLNVEGSAYLPDRELTRRIVALSGDENDDVYTITLGEVYE